MGTKKALIEAQADAGQEPGAKAWLLDRFVGLIGHFNVFGVHANAIPQLVIGLERPLTLKAGQTQLTGEVFWVPAGLSHEFDIDGCRALLVYFDPHHWIARWLRDQPEVARSGLRLGVLSPDGRDAIERLWLGCQEQAIVEQCFCDLFQACLGDEPSPAPLDSRIAAGLQIMTSRIDEVLALSDVAASVGLSEGRFRHLFRAELGIPFSRYRLWLRLCEAFGALFDGVSITDAAHHAYFADSAHLARTFRQMFGDSISGRLLREDHSRFIQGTNFRTRYIPHN